MAKRRRRSHSVLLMGPVGMSGRYREYRPKRRRRRAKRNPRGYRYNPGGGIGIGTFANHLRELADRYKEAQVAIDVGTGVGVSGTNTVTSSGAGMVAMAVSS